MRKLALAFLALLGLTLSLTTCEGCSQNVDGDVEGQLLIPIGADEDCQLDEDVEVDENGDATNTGDFGTVKYHYVLDDKGTADVTDDTCTFVVTRWEGTFADTAEFHDEVATEIDESGLPEDMVTITFESVEIAEAKLRVIQGDGAEFDLTRVGPYHATLNGDDLPEVIDIVYDGVAADPLDPVVTVTDDHTKLAEIVAEAYADVAAVTANGDAAVQVGFEDLDALTNAGTADAQIEISYRLHVTALVTLAP